MRCRADWLWQLYIICQFLEVAIFEVVYKAPLAVCLLGIHKTLSPCLLPIFLGLLFGLASQLLLKFGTLPRGGSTSEGLGSSRVAKAAVSSPLTKCRVERARWARCYLCISASLAWLSILR